MKVQPLGQVKAQFSRFVRECETEPVVITRNGKVVAMLVGASDDDLERLMLARNPRFRAIIGRARRCEAIPEEGFWAIVDRESGGE